MIELWRRVHKDKIPQLESDLDKLHSDMMDARTSEDTEREEILAAIWSTRFIQLIRKNSDLIPYLQALLDEHLIPALPPGAAGEVRNPVINARASGWSRQNIAGRDLHVNGS